MRFVFPAIFVIATFAAGCTPAARTFAAPTEPVRLVEHSDYHVLLKRFVTGAGTVDYDAWHADNKAVRELDHYLSRLAAATPENEPALFAAPPDRLSYWINLYNALVVREILRRWPLSSVRDVSPTLAAKIIKGKGFFADLEFVIGGRSMSLDDIEHQILRRRYADARIHFAINCGSSSCPVLRAEAFDGSRLETQLDEATRQFIASDDNVAVDGKAKVIYLSKIFQWYGDDFRSFATKRAGKRVSLIEWIAGYAPNEKAVALRAAKRGGFDVRYRSYDWSVNRGSVNASHPLVGKRLPALPHRFLDGRELDVSAYRGKTLVIDFWATYCRPCKRTLPELEKLIAARPDAELVLISVDESAELVAEFLRDNGIQQRTAIDPEQLSIEAPSAEVPAALGIKMLPTELVVDATGVIRFVHEGAKPGASAALERELDQLRGERR